MEKERPQVSVYVRLRIWWGGVEEGQLWVGSTDTWDPMASGGW